MICVDDLPQIVGTGANRSKATAQAIARSARTVTGAVAAEQATSTRSPSRPANGSASIARRRRIGSAIDAQMSIYDAKTMRELAFDNDSPGCQTDPRISYTFKEAGEYLVEVKDVLNRGGPEFFYRIRIGDFPLATTPMPMAARRGTKAKIGFAGPAVDGVAPVEVDVPERSDRQCDLGRAEKRRGLHGWPVPLAVSDHDEAVETGTEQRRQEGESHRRPGRRHADDSSRATMSISMFSRAKKGQKLTIEAQTLEVVFADPRLHGAAQRQDQRRDRQDQSADAAARRSEDRLHRRPTTAITCSKCTHLHFAGGPSESYRITVRPPTPGFDADACRTIVSRLRPAAPAAIPVQVVRKGYTGPIELSAQGHPGLTGTATLKAGQNAGVLLVVRQGGSADGGVSIPRRRQGDDRRQDRHPGRQGARRCVAQSMNGLPIRRCICQRSWHWPSRKKPPFSAGDQDGSRPKACRAARRRSSSRRRATRASTTRSR